MYGDLESKERKSLTLSYKIEIIDRVSSTNYVQI